MHELSIVMSILEIATHEAEKERAQMIDEIELDIGCLSSKECVVVIGHKNANGERSKDIKE